MRYATIIAFFLCFQIGAGQECTYTFTGFLTDFHDNSPIEGATVYWKESDTYTTTNSHGIFTLNNLCKQTITLVISHVGCDSLERIFDITESTQQKLMLEHHTEELQGVVVSSTKTIKQVASAQETRLKTATLETYSAASLGTALKEISGLRTLSTGNGIIKPVINGLHSSRIMILTNGVRLQDQEWGIEHAPNVDINTANAITVTKGSSALAYGSDAIGGVIALEPQRIFLKDTLFGKTILNGNSNGKGISASTALSKFYKSGWFITGQGATKQFGHGSAADYGLANTGYKSTSFSGHGGYKQFNRGVAVYYSYIKNTIGILSAAHIGNIEDLVNAINNPTPLITEDFTYDIEPPKQEVTHQIVKATAFQRFENLGKLQFQYDYQVNHRFEFDKRLGENRNTAAVDLKLTTHTVQTNFIWDANNASIFNSGLLFRYQENFANPGTGIKRLIPDYDKWEAGAFITTTQKLGDNLIWDAGARYDLQHIDAKKFYKTSRWEDRGYDVDFGSIVITEFDNQVLTNPIFDYHNFAVATGLKKQWNIEHSALLNLSFANRAPNVAELFSDGLHHSAARIELGDLRLEQEAASRIAGSYTFENDKLSLVIEGFYNRINNYMFAQPLGTEQTIRGAFPVWGYEQTDAALYGLDASITYQLNSRVRVENKSSITKGKDLVNNLALIDIPAFNTSTTLRYNNPKWNGYTFSVTGEFVAEQNEFPNNDFEQFIPSSQQNVTVAISQPPSSYFLTHIKNEINFSLFNTNDLLVTLDVTNALNTSYRDYLSRLRYFADDLGRNISLQLKFKY